MLRVLIKKLWFIKVVNQANEYSFILACACGAIIFSIDEKTKQKNLDKIKALLKAGTRTHVFCHTTRSQLCGVETIHTSRNFYN